MSDTQVWVASPMKANLQSSIFLPSRQILDHGHEVSELLGGVVVLAHAVDHGAAEYFARATTSLWRSTRAMRMSTRLPMTRPESSMDS